MNIKRYLGFAFALLILAAGISGTVFLSVKPDLPFDYQVFDNKIIASGNYLSKIKGGDEIIKFNSQDVNRIDQVEFYADMFSIGEIVNLEIKSGGIINNVSVELESEYKRSPFIYISSTVGLAFWLFGLLVFIKKPGDFTAAILFVMLLLFSAAIMTSPGKNNGNILSYYSLIKVFHFFAYTGGISALIHFSFVFPKKLYAGRFLKVSIYIFFFLFAVLINIVLLKALATKDIFFIDLFHRIWIMLLFVLLAGTVWSTVNFLISFFSGNADSDRRKVQWALWGIFMGVMPYLFFFVIPNLLGYSLPISEEYSIAFFIFIPVSFVIGISRYKLFDIEYIFSKSIVYLSVTLLVTAIFFGIVYLLNMVFSAELGYRSRLFTMISALFIAILFNPIRIKVQKLVDKYFFRIKFEFKNALKKFNDRLNDCNTTVEVCKALLSEINDIIPNKKSAVILKKNNEIIASLNPEPSGITNNDFPVSISLGNIENGGNIVLIIGEKLSGIKYLDKDYEILNAFAGSAYAMINRIELREQVLRTEIERKRLVELNEMKSDFVSSVSHELKTPLTSIQMFAETLMSGKEINRDKINEYAGIIFGESERLTRMINNILDFSKIERGIKQYYFENINLNSALKYVLDSMEYQFRKNNVKISAEIREERIFVNADRDAVAEAIINLLSNAIKYSGENPVIDVELVKEGNKTILSIKDNGKGIDESKTEKIFDKFYRIKKDNEKHIGGAGIGLAIVKNIMEAHMGEIKVDSIPGKGSTFSLIFNISENQI